MLHSSWSGPNSTLPRVRSSYLMETLQSPLLPIYIDMSGKGRSRIDYYGGNLSCMQLNKHGHSALLIVKTVHNDIVFESTLKSTTTHVYKSQSIITTTIIIAMDSFARQNVALCSICKFDQY